MTLLFVSFGSDVSSELGARLRVELEQTERLDAQFVEYLRCRGMNPTVNTDSAAGSMSYSDDLLSPELQVGHLYTWQLFSFVIVSINFTELLSPSLCRVC